MARSNKRKRESVLSSPNDRYVRASIPEQNGEEEEEDEQDEEEVAGTVAVDSSPFTVQWVKDGASATKKPKTKKAQDISEVKFEEGVPEANLGGHYTIIPGSQWEELRKYRNFVVNPTNEPDPEAKHKFEVGQHIFVNHSERPDQIVENDKESWVAQVKEVRASGQHAVYVRVLWYYWPEELPGGRESYHGERELIASTYHQIIDAMTVSGKAQVFHLKDVHDMSTIAGEALYWRQTFDIRKRPQRPSSLPKECVCRTVLNPDVLAVRCSNTTCGKWQHETCLLDATLTRYWEERGSELKSLDGKVKTNGLIKGTEAESEVGDTIVATAKGSLLDKVSDLGRTVIEKLTGTVNGTASKKPQRRSSRKGRRGSKIAQVIDKARPWEGKIYARLEVITNGEGTADFTGKATICRGSKPDDPKDDQDFDEIEVACLFCGQSMVEFEDSDDTVDDVEMLDANLDPKLFVAQIQPSSNRSNTVPDGSSKQNSKKKRFDEVHEAATDNVMSGDNVPHKFGHASLSNGHLPTTDTLNGSEQ